MTKKPSYEQLEQKIDLITRERDQMALMLDAARSIPLAESFESCARFIYDACKSLIGSTCGYVALLSENGSENEVLFLDDGGLPCTVDPDLPMPIQGLRSVAYNLGEAVYENHFMESDWVDLMPDGHVRLDNVMFSPLKIGENTIGVIGLANKPGDFTDQDKAVAESFGDIAALALKHGKLYDDLRDNEKLHREIIENISDAVFITDDQGDFVYICPNTALIFGYEPEEIAPQKNISAFLGAQIFNTDDLNENLEIPNIELEIQDKYDRVHHLLINVKKVSILDGTVLYTCRDISERRRTEKRLLESEERQRQIIENSNAGYFFIDMDGCFQHVNSAWLRLHKYENTDEIIGQHFSLTQVDENQLEAKEIVSNLSKGSGIETGEFSRKCKDGSVGFHTFTARPVIKNSSMIGIEGFLIDSTDKKVAIDALQKKQAELEAHAAKLEQMNTALNVLIEHRDDEKQKRENEIVNSFKKLVFPYFDLDLHGKSRGEISLLFDILNKNIKDILFSGNQSIDAMLNTFTPLEIQVANLIKENKTTKEIANILQTSTRAIYFHRENIRKKLGISRNKTNLKTFLQSNT